MNLEKYRSELNHCLHCHLCFPANWHKLDDWRPVCPSAARFGFEAFYSSGKIQIARGILDGTIQEPTTRLLDVLYTCTGCGACQEQCHEYTGFKADQVDLFEDMKTFCVSKGWAPLKKHEEFARSIKKNHNPYNEPHENRNKWLSRTKLSDNSLIYFIGCTSSYRQKEIAKATVKVLEASNTPFTILGSNEWCCGSPLMRTGQLESVQELISHNIEAIKEIGASTVLFSCAGCFRAFKKDYPRLGFSLPFKIRHTTQFFMDLLNDEKLKVKPFGKSVTYHDPCHLGRHTQVYKPPRRILKSLNIDFKEMPRNSEDAFCCGAGGGARAAYPDYSKWVAKNRLDEAKELKVDIISSACPFCKNNFVETLKEFPEIGLEVRDISEILMEALNE